MNNNPPRVTSWLEILEDCRIEVVRDIDETLHFTLGNSEQDWQHIVFERPALERFVHLAQEVMALQQAANDTGWPMVVA